MLAARQAMLRGGGWMAPRATVRQPMSAPRLMGGRTPSPIPLSPTRYASQYGWPRTAPGKLGGRRWTDAFAQCVPQRGRHRHGRLLDGPREQRLPADVVGVCMVHRHRPRASRIATAGQRATWVYVRSRLVTCAVCVGGIAGRAVVAVQTGAHDGVCRAAHILRFAAGGRSHADADKAQNAAEKAMCGVHINPTLQCGKSRPLSSQKPRNDARRAPNW